jgi:hypothetical protein
MKRRAKLSILATALVVVLVAGRIAWSAYGHELRSTAASSDAARWWRCRSENRPLLRDASEPWSLTYSYTGRMGPGEVWLTVRSDGSSVLRAKTSTQEIVRTHELSLAQRTALADAIDNSALLCLHSFPRDGYIVHDLGRFSLRLTSGTYSHEVIVDECHTISDGAAMGEVTKQLRKLKSALGEEIEWGPYGTAVTAGNCGSES